MNSRSNLKLRPAQAGLDRTRHRPASGLSLLLLAARARQSWRVHERFHRSDLPRTLEVGLIAYTDWNSAGELQRDPQRFNTTVLRTGKPDLRARVDWVRYRPLAPAAGMDARGLTDYAVSDAQILALLAP